MRARWLLLLLVSCSSAPTPSSLGSAADGGAANEGGARGDGETGTDFVNPPNGPAERHTGDPCRSMVSQREGAKAEVFQPAERQGDILWVDTPAITHDKDYFSYAPYVSPGAPTNWLSPRDLVEGQIWLHVEVLETPPGASFPIYYTATWQPGRETPLGGFLRASVAIDKAGPATYDVVADVRQVEFSPDGSCCQNVCGRPWPWDAAWKSVAGDVVVLKGQGFPLKVKTRLVLRPSR